MATLIAKRLSGEPLGAVADDTDTDPSWRSLYRMGAVSAALYILMIILPVVLVFTVPQPPYSGGAEVLQYIGSNKPLYMIEFVSFVGLALPAMVVFLALYVAFRHLDKAYAALGALIGIASEIAAIAYNSSPPSLNGGLLHLSDQYMAAATDAQRASLATAAESLMAVSNTTVNAIGIMTALGILFISLPMLRGESSRGIAYLGIATGIVGILAEPLRELIGFGYLAYGLLLPVWFAAVGWKLYRLGSSRLQSRIEERLEVGTGRRNEGG